MSEPTSVMEIKPPMTKVEIIQETVDWYGADVWRRSVGDNIEGPTCMYRGPDGRRCAISRCVLDESLGIFKEGKGISSHVGEGLFLNEILKPQYRGHGAGFWAEIQILHDECDYWAADGLSKLGKSRVEELMMEYGDKK